MYVCQGVKQTHLPKHARLNKPTYHWLATVVKSC